ncbi:hypothetical protein V5G65_14145 [Mammaliicoccus sciuri]|uniref:hypothetical protein n=1 Tax=Mammaliicoccus sciuri TaxID=1296 RepID=UPI00194F7DB8
MIASQERNESKLLQTQYVQAKKDTQKYVIYHQIIEILEKDKTISNIVKEVNIKEKIYRIKKTQKTKRLICAQRFFVI